MSRYMAYLCYDAVTDEVHAWETFDAIRGTFVPPVSCHLYTGIPRADALQYADELKRDGSCAHAGQEIPSVVKTHRESTLLSMAKLLHQNVAKLPKMVLIFVWLVQNYLTSSQRFSRKTAALS